MVFSVSLVCLKYFDDVLCAVFLCSAPKSDKYLDMWSAVSLLRSKSTQKQYTTGIWFELALHIFSIHSLVGSVSKHHRSWMLAFLWSAQHNLGPTIMSWSLVSLVCSKSVVAPGCAGSSSFLPENLWTAYDELVFCFSALLKYRLPCNMWGSLSVLLK